VSVKENGMISSRYFGIAAVVVGLGAGGLWANLAQAEDAVPGDKSLIENGDAADAGSTVPRSPLRLNMVDYQDNGDGSGKLTVAGIALPGRELYLFLDDQPLATVEPDEGGKWSIESGTALDEGRHTLRADQYDPDTNMLAARAMVSIQRAKDGEVPPAEGAPPKAGP
jgi:hypothetical protein